MDKPAAGTRNEFDKINALIAAFVALISFIIYRLTVAPTLSYWDCGEFIACAHILGNPHPPGSPLFILVGRVFDLLPIGDDVAFRINLLSVVSSAFSAMFAYLIVVRFVSSWYKGTDHYRLGRIIAYVAGITGALFMAFGQTNWNNSVEAEVYGLSTLLMLATFWLGLKFFDHRYSPTGQRIVLLAAFFALLTVGIHLSGFIVVPIVAIFFSLKRDATRADWGMVGGFFVFELLLIMVLVGSFDNYKVFLALSAIAFAGMLFFLRHKIHWPILLSFAAISPIMVGFHPLLAGMISWFVISITVWFIKRDALWRLATLILVAAAIGWSVHIFIPIRSAQHPIIDENTPSRSFKTFVDFLDRKQYGNISMTERMFVRRGAWANQFGDHARMGFLRFFKGQYSNHTLFPLFFIIGLAGMVAMAIKNPAWGYIFIAFVLITSVGLVLYMNFADGTKYNPASGDAYQEVRDRDYFFTPAFLLFGMAIGLGIAGIMELIRRQTAKLGEKTSRLAVFASCILVLTPIIPAQANYFTNDRSKNRMAYNYAYNLLSSCDKDAILFTSGDNDTFPVWCVQEIYDFRQDVRVVNFSLLNTDWYTWQLSNLDFLSAINSGYDLDSLAREAGAAQQERQADRLMEPTDFVNIRTGEQIRDYIDSLGKEDRLPRGIRQRVPMSLSDNQILWYDTTLQGQRVTRPLEPFYDPVRKRPTYLFPMLYDGKALKVATLMMENIILTNKWKCPIYFSSLSGTVRETPLNLMERLSREGLILHLTTEKTNLGFDIPRSAKLFFEVYQYDNVSDTTVAQNENATGIALAYPEKMLDYHNYVVQSTKDSAIADSVLNMLCEAVPSYWRSRLAQRDMYLKKGDSAKAEEIKEEMLGYINGFLNNNPDNVFFHQFLGIAYYMLGEDETAEKYLSQAWELNHDNNHTFKALFQIYAGQGRAGDLLRLAEEYKEYHEDDEFANSVIRNARAWMQQPRQQQMPSMPPVQIQPSQPPVTPPPLPESGG